MKRIPLAAALISTLASAAPALRFQTDVRGDFVLIGNTLGHDCSPELLLPPYNVPLPRTGTVGSCGLFLPDTAMDVFWRADGPAAGQAEADGGVPLSQARSTAVLALPAGAQVTYARLYWSADDSVADTTATVERPGVFSVALNADVSTTSVAGSLVPAYQSSANVTALSGACAPAEEKSSGCLRAVAAQVHAEASFVLEVKAAGAGRFHVVAQLLRQTGPPSRAEESLNAPPKSALLRALLPLFSRVVERATAATVEPLPPPPPILVPIAKEPLDAHTLEPSAIALAPQRRPWAGPLASISAAAFGAVALSLGLDNLGRARGLVARSSTVLTGPPWALASTDDLASLRRLDTQSAVGAGFSVAAGVLLAVGIGLWLAGL